jgi:UDP-N-acetylmuramate--alanine ligase
MTQKGTYYFIGINGVGMSGLASMLVQRGDQVLGSDISNTMDINMFKGMGIQAFNTHDSLRIKPDMTVVYSSAITDDNEELSAARKQQCKIMKRGALLATLSKEFPTQISVAGTHGKTTTSAMLTKIYQEAGLNPSYFIGGYLNREEHGKINSKDIIITELDESDGTFLHIQPNSAIITNLELEHHNYFKSKQHLVSDFLIFINNIIENNGKCMLNIDDSSLKKIYKQSNKPTSFITFGIESEACNISAKNIEYNWQGALFSLVINGNEVDRIQLNLFGKHNVYNALASVAIAMTNNISLKYISKGLKMSSGVKRRMELIYQANNIMLYDDYAHHPTEIVTTIEGVAKSFSQHRIITIFQPHRISRLNHLFIEFSGAFSRTDKVFVMPIFSAGEQASVQDKTSKDLANEINNNGGDAITCTSFEHATQTLKDMIKPKDIILLMGAGNITTLSKDIIPIIQNR